MNQTTEGSKKWNIIVGGRTTPNETGKITMPPVGKGSINTIRIIDDILTGINQEIIVTKNNKEHEKIMEALPGYKEARKDRKTKIARARKNAKGNKQR